MTVAQGQFTIAELRDGTGAGDDVIFYLATDRATGVTVEDPGWTRTPQDMTPEKPYLWTYRLTAYSLPGEEPTEELTGNPVTITNLGDPVPLAGLTAAVEPPARDYHGYDAPWAPGMGKNRIDPDATDAGNGYVAERYLNAAGTLRTASSGASHWHVTEYIPVEPDTVYTLSGLIKAGNSTAPALCQYDANKTYLSGTAYNKRDTVTITTEPECAFVRLSLYDDDEQAQLEAGESATDYAPWANICPLTLRSGCTVTVTPEGGESASLAVTWQDQAGVIYAGTLDVTSGVLTVTRGGMAFDGTEGWGGVGSGRSHFFRLPVPGRITLGNRGCSHFPAVSVITSTVAVGYYAYTAGSRQDGYLQFRPLDPGSWTTDDWKAWLAAQAAAGTPVSAFWLWTEPKVYQLVPQEVRVLAGSATVSCDTGPVTVSRWTDAHATAPVLTGVYGRDGVGIQTITLEYYLSTSDTELLGGEWNENYPTSIPEGTWLWQRTRLDYDDGSAPTYTNPVCVSQGMVTQEQLLREVTQLSSRLEVAEKGITLEALEQTLSTYLDTLNNVRNELQTLGYSLQLTAREGFVIRSVTGLDAEDKPVYGEVETVFTDKAWLMRKRSTREALQQVHADTGATFSQLTLAALNAGETATMELGNLLLVVDPTTGALTGRAK